MKFQINITLQINKQIKKKKPIHMKYTKVTEDIYLKKYILSKSDSTL